MTTYIAICMIVAFIEAGAGMLEQIKYERGTK